MSFNKSNEKIAKEGIVHFWNLPNNIHVILHSKFKDKLMREFMRITRSKYNANKITGISRTTLSRYINMRNPKIRIDFLLKFSKAINNCQFNINEIEKPIKWIGNYKSKGIITPRLPFDFNSRKGARFLAAICNEGWISDGAYYSNSNEELRDSVKEDAISVFGGNDATIKDWVKEKDQYLSFPSVIRDVLVLITLFKGIKSENNPPVPSFILKDKELILGWIEQTIADEGHVKHYPETYRREIVWRRSFNKNLDKYKLNIDERKMLDKIGIKYDLKDIGTYKTKKGIEKVRLQMRLAKRKNLLKLRKHMIIPEKKKDKTFTEITQGYVRYKERLKIKGSIIKICKEKGYVNSSELKKEMKYKQLSTANKWLNFYLNWGLLKYIKKTSYGGGVIGKIPADYALNKP
ncbi:hypothetical protein ISS05_01590 [Candidatus Woesearchaeota archaeon]|nr:hypothetical protein [Candidatus Woesearchaeota archaeon]